MRKLVSVTAGLSLLFSLGAGAASAANTHANARAKLLSSTRAIVITTPTGITVSPALKGQTPTAPVKPTKPSTPATFKAPAPPVPPDPLGTPM